MLAEGVRLEGLTDGYLDITVSPLVNLWGFDPDHHPKFIPFNKMIQQALQNVGPIIYNCIGSPLASSMRRCMLTYQP